MVQRVCIGEKGKVVTVLLKLRDSTTTHNMWEVEHWYTNTHTAQGGTVVCSRLAQVADDCYRPQ